MYGKTSYYAFKSHMEIAYKEKNIEKEGDINPPYAIFSKNYLDKINKLNNKKKYDYCFIGSINSDYKGRKWVINFCKEKFTKNSIYINTDIKKDSDYKLLGEYDYSLKGLGYSPKEEKNYESEKVQYRKVEENKFYFETMCQSKFILCPRGDAPWSFRFYETLMCKSIPIVENFEHTYRTKEESFIDYKYLLVDEEHIYNEKIIKENNRIFKKYHMI